MGRKPSFDREKAVKAALKCFWREGFDKTSLDDLLQAMEIKTSSFYNAFEGKSELFTEVVHYYRATRGRERLNLLQDETVSGLGALRGYFEHLVRRDGGEGFPAGCFMMKTAANLTAPDSVTGKEVATAIANLEAGFEAAVRRGIANGELRASLDSRASAKLLLATAYGISVLTRTQKTEEELLATAKTLLDAFSRAA